MIKLKPLSHIVVQKPNASLLLFLSTLAAVILANTPWGEAYYRLLDFPINFRFGDFVFFAHHGEPMTLLAFVNDALMAIFFFVVGLEIKEEILVGELSSFRKALLPVIAACGGMIMPVLNIPSRMEQPFRWLPILHLPLRHWDFSGNVFR